MSRLVRGSCAHKKHPGCSGHPGDSTASGVSALSPLSGCGSGSQRPRFRQLTPHLSAGSALSVPAGSLQLRGGRCSTGTATRPIRYPRGTVPLASQPAPGTAAYGYKRTSTHLWLQPCVRGKDEAQPCCTQRQSGRGTFPFPSHKQSPKPAS